MRFPLLQKILWTERYKNNVVKIVAYKGWHFIFFGILAFILHAFVREFNNSQVYNDTKNKCLYMAYKNPGASFVQISNFTPQHVTQPPAN